MSKIKIKWPWCKKREDKLSTEKRFSKLSFEDYLNLLKPKNSEERFAIEALKTLCHNSIDYGLFPNSRISYVVYCFDAKDKHFYINYFAKLLGVFKPLWNYSNSVDFLHKLGIRFITRREEVLGLNVRGVLVSKKWIDFLTGKFSFNLFKMNCAIITDWHESMEYFERRMRSRFRGNYFIWMGSVTPIDLL